jgi:hypothetical protein
MEMEKKDTNRIGTVTELKCITYFIELGYVVSVPQNQCRYDIIIDTGNNFLKVQVKTCNTTRNPGSITFSTCASHYIQGKHTHTSYQDDNIDYFCTYYNNECYLVPVSECGHREKCLRFSMPKSGQTKNISFAKDYIASEVLKRDGKLS